MIDDIRIDTVSRIDLEIAPYDWAFPRDQAEKIDAHWAALCAKKPRLFDGRVFMMPSCQIIEAAGERVFSGNAFETGYKSFIAWRNMGFPDRAVSNCFAMAALRSVDGAYMLGRMGPHTASSGKLYFAAGTPDLKDIVDGHVDLEGSALRELAEETGIAAAEISFAPLWTIVQHGPFVACMRPAQSELSAAALTKRCAAFLAKDPEPELDGLVPVFSEADFDTEHMPGFMLGYLRHCLQKTTPRAR